MMAWTEEEREAVKEELWPHVKDEERSLSDRLEAAMGIIEAYWNESYAFYYDQDWEERHPTYKQYGAGFLAHHPIFPGDLMPHLTHHFGVNPDLLVPGHVIWAPVGSPERNRQESSRKNG
jgi:hypothetical protein